MALMFAICSPQPNWMPRKPKLMFQICQKLRRGLSMIDKPRLSFGLLDAQKAEAHVPDLPEAETGLVDHRPPTLSVPFIDPPSCPPPRRGEEMPMHVRLRLSSLHPITARHFWVVSP